MAGIREKQGKAVPDVEPLRSVHTSNLPELFKQLQISLVVSTYQAGKVILIRNDQSVLNTHFRGFAKPMGIAADALRLTIGGTNTVWYYRNQPAVAQKLEPAGKYDGCYLPRRIHVIGTTLETIPAPISYLDVTLLRRRKAIALPPPPATPRRKIGLAWAGSPTHQNDRHRSSALAAFLPVVRTPGIAFYSVQKGERSQKLRQLPPDCTVHDLDALIQDYGDTALLLDSLDLLISVDTAVAHLAGTLASRYGCCCPRCLTGAGAWKARPRPGIPACGSSAKPGEGIGRG